MTRIDARGMRCPWPAIRLARALRTAPGPVEVLADDPAAPREMALVAEQAGATLEALGEHHFRVRRGAG